MLTIKQMEALYWANELGSFGAAGSKLFTTQAAISKRIQEIESAFDVELFDRTKRTARLTDRGRDILVRSTEILRMHTALTESLTKDQPVARRLQLGVTELVALTWLPAFISRLRKRYPHVTLMPRVDSSENLKRQLTAAQVDLILVPGVATHRSDDGIVQKHLGESKHVWMVHSSLLKTKATVSLSALGDMTVLTLNEQSYIGGLVLQWMAGHGVVPKHHLSSNSNSALSGMVMAGLGIANLPLHFCRLARGTELNLVQTSPPLPEISYRTMYRNDGPTVFLEEISSIAMKCCNFSLQAIPAVSRTHKLSTRRTSQ